MMQLQANFYHQKYSQMISQSTLFWKFSWGHAGVAKDGTSMHNR